jgi:4-amino-4-deoxy-L-arabinose transferase and related glycosyltransferases of PMT family
MRSLVERKQIVVITTLLILALGFRLFVALRLPNDTPGDGLVYAQIARNVLEQHVYSHDEQPPFAPSLIRLPGYPFFLAAIYAVSGHGNNTAVRVVQAIVDTFTCVLIALVAFQWTEDPKRKWMAAYAALGLSAVCPFTTIYVATILTEVPTSFLAVLMCLLTTLAMKSDNSRRAFLFWISAGLIAGFAVFFRPDSGLFAAAIGLTILLSALRRQQLVRRFSKAVLSAAVFSIAFCLVLVPWTIRNRRVFGVFQPLSPAHGEMPGEFVPRGYLMWLRTWLDDGRYIGPVLWRLDTAPISIEAFPKRAFDSAEERSRVEGLLRHYNYPGELFEGAGAEGSLGEDEAGEERSEDENDEEGEQDATEPEQSDVEMTPEIDAAFGQLARERISRAPFRYYVKLPVLRASSLWFDTHSQYYPFDGELFPLEDLDYDIGQQYWLPFFAGLTWAFTILGALGGWLLWRDGGESRNWLLLAVLIIFLRIGFFSTLENPEPRYTVEIFPFLSILGGIGISHFRIQSWRSAQVPNAVSEERTRRKENK